MSEQEKHSGNITITDPKSRIAIYIDYSLSDENLATSRKTFVLAAFVGHGEGMTGAQEAERADAGFPVSSRDADSKKWRHFKTSCMRF